MALQEEIMMTPRYRWAAILTMALVATQGASARAQYGYGAYGGWGGGGQTPGSSLARGMGVYAAGAGQYNVETAQARSINANTRMKYNEYMYLSTQNETAKHHALVAGQQANNIKAQNEIHAKLRDHPDQHDIYMGDALNVAVEEIEDPRVYSKNLNKAKVTIGGKLVRDIPFRYAPACITTTIHDLVQGPPPAPLLATAFDDERAAFKALAKEIRKSIDKGEAPDPDTVNKALVVVSRAVAKADQILPRNTKDRNDADKYLKSLHGLLGMLKSPALNLLLAGVENHPNATLGELLAFMSAYELRFGQAKTEPQRLAYDKLYPLLVDLRDEVAPALAGTPPPKADPSAVGEFYSQMSYDELRRKSAAPPQPGGGQR
jgi:hypothetical protein